MTTVCLLGCGALARVFAQNLNNVFHGSVTLVGAYCRTPDACRTFCREFRFAVPQHRLRNSSRSPPITSWNLPEAAPSEPPQKPSSKKRTSSRRPSVPGRIPTFSIAPKRRQKRCGTRLFIPNGAVGGLDLLQTYALMGDAHLTIENEKAPKSLNGAPYLAGRTLSETAAETVFTGSVKDAIAGFPKNVNVAVAASLAAAAPTPSSRFIPYRAKRKTCIASKSAIR